MNMEIDISRLRSLTMDLAPMRISEIVLKTSRYPEMRTWYQMMLGIAPFLEHEPSGPVRERKAGEQERASDTRLCFFRLHMQHPYVQIVALFDIPGTRTEPSGDPGLHHMQLRCPDLPQLFERYERLKSVGVMPHRTANHGPGTSFYFRDPDGNIVEIAASNFASLDEYQGFLRSDSFRKNPSGIEIDADEYIGRYKRGTPLEELVRIPA